MCVIVGLGNPGNAYTDSRHNIGFMVLGAFAEQYNLPSFVKSSRYASLCTEGAVAGESVSILLPITFMNASGIAVSKYLKERGKIENLIVVHDDVDLPLGEMKISCDRGAGGHNGVQSIIDTLKTRNFTRLRVGVAEKDVYGVVKRPRGDELSSFVLGTFTTRESALLPAVCAKASDALVLILTKGTTHAMQAIN